MATGPDRNVPGGDAQHLMRVLRVGIMPPGDPIFSERVTVVEINDDAGGEFVTITQDGGRSDFRKSLAFDPGEWPVVRDAIDFMVAECRNH